MRTMDKEAERKTPTNAWDVLRELSSTVPGDTKKTKKRKHLSLTSGSLSPTSDVSRKRVDCPTCGSSIALININFHLDQCIRRQQRNYSSMCSHPLNRKDSDEKSLKTSRSKGGIVPRDGVSRKDEDCTTSGDDAFAHMMNMSQHVFTKPPLSTEIFYLSDKSNYDVLWSDQNGDATDSSAVKKNVVWSATVLFRKINTQLTICTSVVPQPMMSGKTEVINAASPSPRSRWVWKYHSRLSISVLKSMLQKSIRRRRPLPSVRISMELYDRAPGELLRRLPIIILEDSTLHPDVAFVVWLMMAESKGYEIPDSLARRLFTIIYEVASCRWIDRLSQRQGDGEKPSEESIKKLKVGGDEANAKDESSGSNERTDVQAMLKAMYFRSQYGGMSCDIRMLALYERVWRNRFEEAMPLRPELSNRVMGGRPTSMSKQLYWSEVPLMINSLLPSQQRHLENILMNGIPLLEFKDVSIEGVDFHCSPILEEAIMKDSTLVREMLLYLRTNKMQIGSRDSGSDVNEELLRILKHCMWTFSSGVNRRQVLEKRTFDLKADTDKEKKETAACMENFWNQYASSRVKLFMLKFVLDRLPATT